MLDESGFVFCVSGDLLLRSFGACKKAGRSSRFCRLLGIFKVSRLSALAKPELKPLKLGDFFRVSFTLDFTLLEFFWGPSLSLKAT